MFWAFGFDIWVFFKYLSRHDINEEDTQHSQPHMILYCAEIFEFGVEIVNVM